MFHVCRGPVPSHCLQGGCSRSSNANPTLVTIRGNRNNPQNQAYTLVQCHICRRMGPPPTLWICEHRRPQPDQREACAACAAQLLYEDPAGAPSLCIQNSQTVLITSILCAKVAHELQTIAPSLVGVGEPVPTLHVGLEATVLGRNQRIDGLVYLDDHVIVLVENQMSDSKNYDEDEQRVRAALGFTLELLGSEIDARQVPGRYGLIFDFLQNKTHHHGRPAMHWLMHRTGSYPLLQPILLPKTAFRPVTGVQKTEPVMQPIKEDDLNKHIFCLHASRQVLLRTFSFLTTDELEIENKVYKDREIENRVYKDRVTRQWNIKHLLATPKQNAVLGLHKLTVAPIQEEDVLPRDCLLCAAPLVRADDPSTSLTLLELQTQARRQLPRERVHALVSRGRAVRLPWGSARACLPCAALLEKHDVQGALQASVEIFPETAMAQETVVQNFDPRAQSDLVVTEVHGEALRFHFANNQREILRYQGPPNISNNTLRDLLEECQQILQKRALNVQYRQFRPGKHWLLDQGQVWQCVAVASLPSWNVLNKMCVDIQSTDNLQVYDIFMRTINRNSHHFYWITHVNEEYVYYEQLYPQHRHALAEDKKISSSTAPVSSMLFKVVRNSDQDFKIKYENTGIAYTIKHVSRIGVAGIRSRELVVNGTIEMPVWIQNDGPPNNRGTFLQIDPTREFVRLKRNMLKSCKWVSHERLRQKFVQFLFNSIHDITHSILQRPQEERKEWHTALYVAVGAVPAVEALQKSEENYVGSVLRASAAVAPNVPRTLTAARYWRASGCAAWLWMRAYDKVYGAMRLDVFLHFVWDNHVLQQEQRFEDGDGSALEFERMVSRDNFKRVSRDVVQFLRRNNNAIPPERWIEFEMADVLPGDVISTGEAERFRLKVPWWIVQWHLALWQGAEMTPERATCMVRAACKDAGRRVLEHTEVLNPPSAVSDDSAWRRAESQLDVETGSQFARGRAGMVLQAAAAVVGEFAQAGAVEALREWRRCGSKSAAEVCATVCMGGDV